LHLGFQQHDTTDIDRQRRPADADGHKGARIDKDTATLIAQEVSCGIESALAKFVNHVNLLRQPNVGCFYILFLRGEYANVIISD
jgi:hypothetical protein